MMRASLHPRSWSLMVKLPLTIGLIIGCVAMVIGIAIVKEQQAQGTAALEERTLTVARAVAAAAPEAALRNDYWTLHKVLATMTRRTATAGSAGAPVTTAMILDPGVRTLASLEPRVNPIALPAVLAEGTHAMAAAALDKGTATVRWLADESVVEGAVPVTLNGTTLAAVVVRLSAADLSAALWEATRIILGLTVLLAIAGSVAAAMISRRMVRPLKALAGGMDVIGRGGSHLIPESAVRDRDEIGRLVDRFNRMSAELAEARRKEQELAVNEKLVAVGRIAAGVAHEVNNPLAGMLNCLDTLRSRPGDQVLVERYLPVIEQGLHRIQGIVQGLLSELRDGRGTGGCATALGDPADLRDLLAADLRGRALRLDWDVEAAVAPILRRPSVQQAVTNLVKNAVAAMPDGGRVGVRAHARGDEAVIEVEDEGHGIAQEDVGRIFDPFYTTRNDGTGLGLWITWRLIDDLGGAIAVDSEPGVGTIVRLCLPLNQLMGDMDERMRV